MKKILYLVKTFLPGLISFLLVFGLVHAGSLNPSATPAATSYTLSDIYTRLTTNAAATVENHNFFPSALPASSFYTLTQIYDAIPTMVESTIKSGTPYLGVTGTLTPNGTGTAAVADVFYGKTANLTGDWDLDTGTLNLACNIATFTGADNLVSTTYDGDGSGNNRWCITDSGDAAATDILSGKIAWVDGAPVTGTVAAQSLSAGDEIVNAGSYAATTLSAVDADLVVGNIKSGVTIFGKAGSYSGYPGTGWTGTAMTQSICDAQNSNNWYWFADANGDGDTTDPEDGICVQTTTVTATTWNGPQLVAGVPISGRTATGGSATTIADTDGTAMTANAYVNMVVKISAGTAVGCWGVVKSNTTDTVTVYGSWLSSAYASNCGTPDLNSTFLIDSDGFDLYDNSWIGDWACVAGSNALNGTVSWGSFPTTTQAGSSIIALATTDCYDGTRDLLPTEASRAVITGTATGTSTTSITDSSLSLSTNAWVGQKVLITGGTGSGGWSRIESNTATVITFAVDNWTGGIPTVGSTFAIVYLIPHANYNPGTSIDGDVNDQLNGNNGPLTHEVLKNWKGTRLPTSGDFFGFCGYKDGGSNYESTSGSSTADKSYGNFGGQVGRTDEFLDLANSGVYEWLSELHHYYNAQMAGFSACSMHTNGDIVTNTYKVRGVFRP